ncbi:hypothetical protein ACFXG4_07465 [Nocardia sp. NPDC059246]|uniref:hypothetical protein n=1 Tax=unclassified Nocardia TaxID=2637762 RepID=UPI0036B9E944
MVLAKRATGGDVIWMCRAVQRVESQDSDDAVQDIYEASVKPSLGRDARVNDAPILDIRGRLALRNDSIDATFEVVTRFIFANDQEMPEIEEVREFLRDYGIDYTFGYIRAALADDLRVFGLQAGVLPVTALDEVRFADLVAVHAPGA